MSNVLAVDPSSKTGWAIFVGQELCGWGEIKSKNAGDKWARLDDTFQLFEALINDMPVPIDAVVVEGVLPNIRHIPSLDGQFWTMAMYLNAGVVATDAGLKLVEAPVTSVKANIAPDWKTHPKRKTKWPVIDAVNDRFGLNLRMKDNNAADAIAIGCWAIDRGHV